RRAPAAVSDGVAHFLVALAARPRRRALGRRARRSARALRLGAPHRLRGRRGRGGGDGVRRVLLSVSELRFHARRVRRRPLRRHARQLAGQDVRLHGAQPGRGRAPRLSEPHALRAGAPAAHGRGDHDEPVAVSRVRRPLQSGVGRRAPRRGEPRLPASGLLVTRAGHASESRSSPRSGADLGACIARFIDHLAHERRASPHTVAAYRRDLEGLCAFATERLGRPSRLGDVDRLLLRAYLSQLAESRGAATLGRKLASLRTFFRYLEQNAVTRDNPAAALASPKIRRRLPRVLDAETAAEVMDAPRTRDDGAESARDAALLELLYGSGLRVSELVGLDLE